MSHLQFRAVDRQGRIYEVTDLFDVNGIRTFDIARAESCVVKYAEDAWEAISIDDVPIYTVQ